MAASLVRLEQITPGDVLTFYYLTGNDKRPTVLYITMFKNLLNGININYLSQSQINYLKIILNNADFTSNVENPQFFYEKYVRNADIKIAYRTYRPLNILQLYKVSYKLSSFESDLGIQPRIDTVTGLSVPFVKNKYTTAPDIKTLLPDKILPVVKTETPLPKNLFGWNDNEAK
jgi:hypothetical protein